MKTIFRFVGFGVLLAAFIAVGSMAGFAQDPCADAEGKTALDTKIRDLLTKKDIPGRKAAIDSGKQFLEKYGACPDVKEFADYLNTNIPLMETKVKAMEAANHLQELLVRFNTALKSKNWDELYASGKEILTLKPDDYRDVELALGSVGLEETAKPQRVTKWNEDTLRFAKQSIQDLEANKTFKTYGISIKDGANFQYKNKDDALGWMNFTIGYIYFYDKKNKKDGISYIYKASQLNSDTKTNPVVFESIGAFYYDDVIRLAKEVKVLIDAQQSTDTPEVVLQKVNAIKTKVGMVNGTTERALDAYAQAYALADKTEKGKAYRDTLHKTLQDLYAGRFVKADGFEAWLKGVGPKQLPDPLSTIIPINDPESVAPATITTTTNTTPGTIKPPPATTPAKTPVTTTTPSKTPVSTTKRPAVSKAVVKKPVVRKRGA